MAETASIGGGAPNQKFVIDIVTQAKTEALSQVKTLTDQITNAQISLAKVMAHVTTNATNLGHIWNKLNQGFAATLNAGKSGGGIGVLGVAGGFVLGNAFVGLLKTIDHLIAKVPLLGQELYYLNRRLAEPGTAGLFNLAFAGQMIGLSREQTLGTIESMGASIRTNPGLQGLLSRFVPGYKGGNQVGAENQLGLVNQLKGQFGEKGYYIAAQFAELFGIGEHEFRQMWTNIEELNKSYKVHGETLKEFGLDTDRSSKAFVEFHRQLTALTSVFEIIVTKWSAWLAEHVGTPILESVNKNIRDPALFSWKSLFPQIGWIESLVGGSPSTPSSPVGSNKSSPSFTPSPSGGMSGAIKNFMSMGMPYQSAVGAAIGIKGESGFDPTSFNPNGGGRGAYGLANWRGDRMANFERMFGHSIFQSTAAEQWAFIQWELQGGDAGASTAFKMLKEGGLTAGQAQNVWAQFYERHGNASYSSKLSAEADSYASKNPNVNIDSDQHFNITIQGNADKDTPERIGQVLKPNIGAWDTQMKQAVRANNFR